MSEAKSTDVDPVMNTIEEEVESDAGEGEEDSDGKEEEKVKLRVKKKSPQEMKAEKKITFRQAADDILAGKFKNIRQAAQAYGISYGVLWAGMVKRGHTSLQNAKLESNQPTNQNKCGHTGVPPGAPFPCGFLDGV